MIKYDIAFIDEEQSSIDEFTNYFDFHSKEIRVNPIDPDGKSVEEILDIALESKNDIIVIDYYLKYSKSGVEFNGDTLLNRIKDRRLNIPLIIFTSQRSRAENGFLSLETLICDKSEINEIEDKTFLEKILSHIKFYVELKNKMDKEFSDLRLRQVKGEVLNSKEKLRIIELNNLLEEMVDRRTLVKPIENQEKELKTINELLESTNNLLNKFGKEDEYEEEI